MARTNEQTIALSLLAAVEGAHFFSARLPSKMTILKFVEDDQARKGIEQGIIEACILSMGLQVIVAWLSRSWLPLLVGAGATAVMAWLSWRDLQASPAMQGK